MKGANLIYVNQEANRNQEIKQVIYAPRMKLGLGEHLDPQKISEGVDVYFICSVSANPPVYKVTWYIEDKKIVQDPHFGILISDNHLVIQKISRKWTGNYTCKASNIIGDAGSNNLTLVVRFAPICAIQDHAVYEGSLKEDVYLPCEVLAYPMNASFYWTFSNSVTEKRLPQEWLSWKGLKSVLKYRANSLQDFGTLQCWAANSAGQQKQSCTLSYRVAGVPAPPGNCSVSNQTWNTLEVMCLPPNLGYSRFVSLSGEQGHGKKNRAEDDDFISTRWTETGDVKFILTVFERNTMTVAYNKTGSTGFFVIKGLSSGLDYLIKISRFNSRGKSSEITLEALTLRAAENRMRNNLIAEAKTKPMNNWYATTIGSVSGAAIALLIMVSAMYFFVRRKIRRSEIRDDVKRTDSVQLKNDQPDLLDKNEANKSSASVNDKNLDNNQQVSTSSKCEDILPHPPSEKSSSQTLPYQLQSNNLQPHIHSLPQAQLSLSPFSLSIKNVSGDETESNLGQQTILSKIPSSDLLPSNTDKFFFGINRSDSIARKKTSEIGHFSSGTRNKCSEIFLDPNLVSYDYINQPTQKFSFIKHCSPQMDRESFL